MEKIKKIFLIPFLLIWHIQRMVKRNPRVWIFGDRFGEKCSDNTGVFFEYVTKYHSDIIDAIWLTRSEQVYYELKRQGCKVHYAGSFKGALATLKAGIVLYSVSKRDVNPYFTNGAVLVNVCHGAPIKNIGLIVESLHNSKARKSLNALNRFLFPYLDGYLFDYMVNTSPFFSDILTSSFGIQKKDQLLTGYPRNDVFFSDGQNEIIEEIDNEFNCPRKIIYLPTWRRVSENDPFTTNKFDHIKWNEFLISSNSVLLIKGHPGIEPPGGFSNCSSGRIIRIDENPMLRTNEILSRVDVLITDYSSAYFDFLLKENGQIILFPYDYEKYASKDSGFAVEYDKDIAGTRCCSWEHILTVLKKGTAQKNDIDISAKFNYYRNGNSCCRLYSELIRIMNIPDKNVMS